MWRYKPLDWNDISELILFSTFWFICMPPNMSRWHTILLVGIFVVWYFSSFLLFEHFTLLYCIFWHPTHCSSNFEVWRWGSRPSSHIDIGGLSLLYVIFSLNIQCKRAGLLHFLLRRVKTQGLVCWINHATATCCRPWQPIVLESSCTDYFLVILWYSLIACGSISHLWDDQNAGPSFTKFSRR
jgi:hypothetical protein